MNSPQCRVAQVARLRVTCVPAAEEVLVYLRESRSRPAETHRFRLNPVQTNPKRPADPFPSPLFNPGRHPWRPVSFPLPAPFRSSKFPPLTTHSASFPLIPLLKPASGNLTLTATINRDSSDETSTFVTTGCLESNVFVCPQVTDLDCSWRTCRKSVKLLPDAFALMISFDHEADDDIRPLLPR